MKGITGHPSLRTDIAGGSLLVGVCEEVEPRAAKVGYLVSFGHYCGLPATANMSDETAAGNAAAAAATPKKKAKSAAKKPKTAPSHPKVADMVNDAIQSLKERGGSSLQAIKKHISANNKVDMDRLTPFVRKYLKNAVAGGTLIQTKGKGASGSFKLSASGQKEPGKAKKAGSPVKKAKPAAKKAAAKPKAKAAEKKKPAAKKPAAKKAAKPKSPKKAAKPSKPKTPKAKKMKSPKKAAPKKAKK